MPTLVTGSALEAASLCSVTAENGVSQVGKEDHPSSHQDPIKAANGAEHLPCLPPHV